MTTVYRVTAVWSGFTGAPGYSKFSFQDLTTDTARNAAGAAVRAFFFGLGNQLATTWKIDVLPEVQEFDMATGTLTGANAMTTTPTQVAGMVAAAPYAGGSGFTVNWRTGLIFMGRRVMGRTFIVPAIGCFENDGTLTSSAITAIQASANALIAASGAEFAIWAKSYNTAEPPVQIGGALAPVQTAVIRDSAAQLRSRRM